MSVILGCTRNKFFHIASCRPLHLASVVRGRGRGGRAAPVKLDEPTVNPASSFDSSDVPNNIWTSYKLPGTPRRLYQAVIVPGKNFEGMSREEKSVAQNLHMTSFETTLQGSFSRRAVFVTGLVGMLCMSNLIIFPSLSIAFGVINAIVYSGVMFSFSYGNQIARQPLRGLWYNEETGVATVAVESYNFHKNKESNVYINIPPTNSDFDVGGNVKAMFASSETMEKPKNYFDKWGRTCAKLPFPEGICILFGNIDLSASLVDGGHANTCVWIEPKFFKTKIYEPEIAGNEEIFDKSEFFSAILNQMRKN